MATETAFQRRRREKREQELARCAALLGARAFAHGTEPGTERPEPPCQRHRGQRHA
jgi:hypothetical protein